MPVGEDDSFIKTDVEGRKHGEQTGFETLVVHVVNSECCNLRKLQKDVIFRFLS